MPAAVALGTIILAYVIDWSLWRHNVATGGNAYENLTVQYYYAIQEKNGKTEYDYQPPQIETCTRTLFPHAGHEPCWYVRKHTEKAIRI